ncbi:MAG: DUF5723 family protein [Siphonobacter sp.]
MSFNRFTILAGFLVITWQTHAQNFMGISQSNYAGTNSVYVNPALLADSRYKFYINLGAVNVNVFNNYAKWVGPYKLTRLFLGGIPKQYQNSDGSPALQPTYFKEILDGKTKNGTSSAEVRGPGVLFSVGNNHTFAVTTRARASLQAYGFSENMLSLIRQGLDLATLWNITNVDNRFSANGNAYGEVALSYASTLIDAGKHYLKGGITAKRLVGFYSAHIRNRELSYRVIEDPQNPGKGLLVLDKMDADFGYTLQNFTKDGLSPGKFLGHKMPGLGWGFDAGLVYEFRPIVNGYLDEKTGKPDVESNKYKIRVSASLMDVGTIRYEDPALIKGYTINRSGKTIREDDFNDVKGSDELVRLIEDKLDLQASEAKNHFVSGLPMALNTNIDFRLGEEFCINVAYIRDLRSISSISMRQPTIFAITPRIESEVGIEIAVPLTWVYNTFSPGVSVKIGPVFAGTDNLIGLFGATKMMVPQGLDVYAGISVPIYRRN